VKFNFSILLVGGIVLSACTSAVVSSSGESLKSAQPVIVLTEADVSSSPTVRSVATPTDLPEATKETEVTEPTPTDDRENLPPRGAEREFSTDFSIHTVPYTEILSGGPPKDGIPSIDDPKFISVADADEWIDPVEPVALVQVGEDIRAYPLQILTWHEIVNDTVGGVPLIVTFCPLCNTAIAFERTHNGQIFDFGTTGRLRYSNLIMYDRQTETWWQQADGTAIAGELTGSKLNFHPVSMISWESFTQNYPDGKVLSRETGYNRRYGQNPYAGYDSLNKPFLYFGPGTPNVLSPLSRVLTIDLGESAVAYPYSTLSELNVVNDTVAGDEIVVFWLEGTASALDSVAIAGGRDVGAATAYSREVGGEILEFRYAEGKFFDRTTGSEWNVLGQAVNGPLKGKQLTPVVSINHFWFSWAAFRPDTRIFTP